MRSAAARHSARFIGRRRLSPFSSPLGPAPPLTSWTGAGAVPLFLVSRPTSGLAGTLAERQDAESSEKEPHRTGEGALREETQFLDLQSLIRQLRDELPARPSKGDPISGEVVAKITKMLQNTKLNPREWRQHAVYRRGRYTRNIVGYSPNQFVALLLCWERGQQSPIHDHTGAHCFIKMLSGKLTERHFAWAPDGSAGPEADAEPLTMDASVPSMSVGFMHDSLGLHRIENPSSEEAAVSLHIYSPPFQECLVFPPTGGPPRTAPMVSVFDSGSEGQPQASPTGGRESLGAPQSLHDFCMGLSEQSQKQEAGTRLDSNVVMDLLLPTDMSPMEWASFASPAHFSEFHPVQHVIHCDDEFSVIVTCWSPGQFVPAHTVGRGRAMWLKVVHGNLCYEEFSGGLFPWENGVESQKVLAEGSTSSMEECGVRLHRLVNQSDNQPAVSVQVFSPPLTQFTFNTVNGTERKDIHRLLGQGGVAAPVAAESMAASMRGLVRTAGCWYLSFSGLKGLLQGELSRPDASDAAVSALLRKAVFNPDEWRERLVQGAAPGAQSLAMSDGEPSIAGVPTPRYVLLAQEKHYTMLLAFWEHRSHEHCVAHIRSSGRSWTLVLEGELEERTFFQGSQGPELRRAGTLKEESLSFVRNPPPASGGGSPHSEWTERSHESDSPCVSLHIYCPQLPEVS
ncbi:unnamed protein product [Polarella glacialis]|uniref:cysteine dioxygenase n=1 Tax=Polarella glacialis TaxID=89957 RepID=A0A813DVH4_POLGL|nr:unnamed protein product [Polarella glacialis]CAE8636131.1 unnamed protein product [Polarella glacialis]